MKLDKWNAKKKEYVRGNIKGTKKIMAVLKAVFF